MTSAMDIETLKRPVVRTAEAQPATRLHLAYVDGLRFLLALWVMLGHTWQGFGGEPTHAVTLLTVWLLRPHLAVSAFLVVSGFSLALPIARRGVYRQSPREVAHFLFRRARRILPPYFAALALTLALLWTGLTPAQIMTPSHSLTVEAVLAHLAMAQDWLAPSTISGPFWSIAVEWRIYFLFPLLLLFPRLLGARWGALALFMGAILLSALAWGLWVAPQAHPLVTAAPTVFTSYTGLALNYFALFIAGALGALVAMDPRFATLRTRVPWTLMTAILLLATGLLLCYWMLYGGRAGVTPSDLTLLDTLVGTATAATLLGGVAGGVGGRTLVRVLGWRPLAWLGGFAYSIYLLHYPFFTLVYVYAARPLATSHGWDQWVVWGLLMAALPVILALCYLFHCVAERPFMSVHSKHS